MNDHDVVVDRTETPAWITFADTFNLTVPFVDRHLAEGRADKVVARWADRSLTFGALAENVYRMANVLRGMGIGPGDRVMMIVRDVPAFLYGFLGAARLGAVTVPVNYFLRAKDYAYMMRDSQARVVIASSETFDEVEAALQEDGHVVAHRIAEDAPRDGWLDMDALLADAEAAADPYPTTPRSPCFWLYSSGSTGDPKASVHQHKDMIYTSELVAVGISKMTEDDVIFSAPKLFFAYGIGNSLSFPLWTGAEVTLMEDRPTAENTLDHIARFKPTIYYGVPTLYAMQLAALEGGHEADVSSIRYASSGGEALPPAVYEGWKSLTGIEILDGIGSSEALHLYTHSLPGEVRPGAAGRMVPGYEARIVGDDGKDLPDGEVGELVIRGASVTELYWNKPEKTGESMRDGWFHTGDSCSRDADGYIYFSGRGNDMLKVGGIWVSPFEVESALCEHQAVVQAAVVGWPDDQGLIKPKGYVVLRDGETPGPALEQDLIHFIRDKLAPFKYPRWIEFVDDLPKTGSGKVQRFRLRDGG